MGSFIDLWLGLCYARDLGQVFVMLGRVADPRHVRHATHVYSHVENPGLG